MMNMEMTTMTDRPTIDATFPTVSKADAQIMDPSNQRHCCRNYWAVCCHYTTPSTGRSNTVDYDVEEYSYKYPHDIKKSPCQCKRSPSPICKTYPMSSDPLDHDDTNKDPWIMQKFR